MQIDYDNIKKIRSIENYVFFIQNDGTGFEFGEDNNNLLGQPDTVNKTYCKLFNSKEEQAEVREIKAVHNMILIIKNDNTLWACGNNTYQSMGLGEEHYTLEPLFIKLPIDDVKTICMDYFYPSLLYVLKNDGTLWIAGEDETQYMPEMSDDYPIYPSFVQIASDVKQVYANQPYCSIIIKNDNTVWFRGLEIYGNSGIRIGIMSENYLIPEYTQIPNLSGADIKDIITGVYFTAILKNDGTVWVSGMNANFIDKGAEFYETFTQIPTLQNIKKIYAHMAPSDIIASFYALTEDNVLQGIGTRYFGGGEFGPDYIEADPIGAVTITSNVTEAFYFYCYLCFKQNDKYYYIDVDTGEFLPIESCGYFKPWGYNTKPIDNIKQILTPFTSGFVYLDDNDDMYYGLSEYLAFYSGSSYACYNKYYRTGLKRMPISNIKDIVFSENGLKTVYVLTEDGKVYGKGSNVYGQLGLGDNIDRDEYTLLPIDNVKKIDTGNEHTIILKNDGTVWSTGRNPWGNLGLGNYTDQNTFKQVTTPNVKFKDIGVYNVYSILIDENGNLYGAGSGHRNGSGSNSNIATFTKCTSLPSPVKELIGCSNGYNTVVLLEDKTVWTCGEYNKSFGLVDSLNFVKIHDFNNIEKVVINPDITAMLLINSNKELFILGDNKIKVGNSNQATITTPLKIADNVKDVYMERKNVFYIKEDNTLWSYGLNFGQISPDITPFWTYIDNVKVAENIKECFPRETAVTCNSDFIFIKDLNGHIYATGNNVYGQLGFHELDENYKAEEIYKFTKLENPSEFKNGNLITVIDNKYVNVKSFASSKNHSFIITDNGDVYFKGNNEHGQLPTESSYTTNYQYMGNNIEAGADIKEIECGETFTLILYGSKSQIPDFVNNLIVIGTDPKGQLSANFNPSRIILLKNINHVKVIDDITIVEDMNNEIYVAYKGSGFINKEGISIDIKEQ